jgi:hypothetical protein
MEVSQVNWVLLNVPLCVMFFLAFTAIPFWMVIKHPDQNPVRTEAAGQSTAACVPVMTAASLAELPRDLAVAQDRRELVGASAGVRG